MSNYAIPPDSIYDKSLMLDNGYVLSVSIQPLSYSFTEHRARYKILFNIESEQDYGDGLAYLYEDDRTLIPTQFLDENITPDIILKLNELICSDFWQNNLLTSTYLIPDFS